MSGRFIKPPHRSRREIQTVRSGRSTATACVPPDAGAEMPARLAGAGSPRTRPQATAAARPGERLLQKRAPNMLDLVCAVRNTRVCFAKGTKGSQ